MELRKHKDHKLKYSVKTSAPDQIFREIRDKLLYKITRKRFKPWMKPKEIDLITELLLNLQPKKCLEWGTGYSTVTFPSLLKGDYHWLSIEHNKEWSEKIKAINKDDHTEIKFIPPNQYPFTDPHNDGSCRDLKNYIEYPPPNQDFVLVDGRARSCCVKKAHELLNDDGVVVLHDANRKHYHKFFVLFKHQSLFLDFHRGRRGIWIGSKGKSVDQLIDMPKHRKIWHVHNQLGKFFGKK